MIVYNLHAIFQLIIGALVVWLLSLGATYFGFDLVGGSRELWFSLQLIATISIITEVKGLKGRLFWIPVWMLTIILSFLAWLFVFPQSYASKDMALIGVILYTIVNLLFYNYMRNQALLQNFIKAKQALPVWAEEKKNQLIDYKAFWNIASHAYFSPPIVFLKLNWLWNLLNRNTVSSNEFLIHYQAFFRILDDAILKEHNAAGRIHRLRSAILAAENFASYKHEWNSLYVLEQFLRERARQVEG